MQVQPNADSSNYFQATTQMIIRRKHEIPSWYSSVSLNIDNLFQNAYKNTHSSSMRERIGCVYELTV